ncbi:Toprim domain-containing protein [Halopenitus malekzadehii]|uniref:DNA primase DnaG n=1 Tax=Halopenitus malekzadehii TaxID=1267564 RepID=A0A1H6JJ95_9EURY|nr:DNA primase DnaG [Halopenitus malekzadehii]SEH62416.1 Toprim domain-containing protein [Halopenitus malekzadehii]
MEDTAKYLIHATIAADGVVERSDVVGAVFGQTEGLLGEELDLRDLQQSSKVGRIDVSIESENGQSFGEVTVASSLDKVETAILAAALETITRVGPCRASVEVTQIEDVRATKRREVVDRAKELLAGGFEETALSSDEVLEEVRDAARIEGIAEYEGLPAGPRVRDSDAIIVVEGRADVLTLLDAGIKNGIAVEGTNVPEAVADLSQDRTVTAFLDGDRGGELILRELGQVGDVDYVAFAPAGESVEDLDRSAVLDALRGKVPYETLAEEPNAREVARDPPSGSPTTESSTPGGATEDPSPTEEDADTDADVDVPAEADADVDASAEADARSGTSDDENASVETSAETTDDVDVSTEGDDDAIAAAGPGDTKSVRDHVSDVVAAGTGRARLLGQSGEVLAEVDAAAAFDALEDADPPPHAVVLDGEISQRLLDIAAQRGVSQVFGRSTGSVVKQPIGTRVTTVEDAAVEA